MKPIRAQLDRIELTVICSRPFDCESAVHFCSGFKEPSPPPASDHQLEGQQGELAFDGETAAHVGLAAGPHLAWSKDSLARFQVSRK